MDSYYSETSKVLEEFLIGRKYQIEPPQQGNAPLFLILTLPPDLVGFAVLGNNIEQDTSAALERIRSLYAINAKEWADFDLSLVVCGTKVPEEFRLKFEIDPYFCRKFVVDMNKVLRDEFGRLPFIPLGPESIEKISGLKRPISAQTYLKKHGLSSELAKYLAVPHELGEKRIIEKCLSGEISTLDWIEKEKDEFQPIDFEAHKTVRLKKIEINNFRAYKGNYEFDLDGDLIVLYGPNGFGKTSFFDAIDFICTGGITKFDERINRKVEKVKKLFSHLDSDAENCYVKATIYDSDHELCIERYLRDWANTKVGEDILDRKKTLMRMSGLTDELLDLRVENFVRLFRATHLFGQYFQALTYGMRDESKLPADTVSRMLAFQDYVEAINKARKVSEELTRLNQEQAVEFGLIKESLEAKRKDLSQLQEIGDIVDKPEIILKRGKEVADRIEKELQVNIELPEKIDQKVIANWRGILEEQIGHLEQKLEIVNNLVTQFPKLIESKEKMNSLKNTWEQLNKTLAQLTRENEEKKKIFKEFEEKRNQAIIEEESLAQRVETFNWFFKTKPESEDLKKRIVAGIENKKKSQLALLSLSKEIDKLQEEKVRNVKVVNEINDKVGFLRNKIKSLNEFSSETEAALKLSVDQNVLKKKIKENEGIFPKLGKELSKRHIALRALEQEFKSLKEHLIFLQRSQSELQSIFDGIKKYITSKICPVCGTSHRSKEDLLVKLNSQKGIQHQDINKTLKLLETKELEIKKENKNVNALELEKMKIEEEGMDLGRQLKESENKLKHFYEIARLLDIDPETDNIRSLIEKISRELEGQIEQIKKDLLERRELIEVRSKELEGRLLNKKEIEQQAYELEVEIAKLQALVENNAKVALKRQISFDFEIDKAKEASLKLKEKAENLKNKIKDYGDEYFKLKDNLTILMSKISLENKQREELESAIREKTRFLQGIENFARKIDFNYEKFDLNTLESIKDELTKRFMSLDVLRSEILNFENVMNTSQRTAGFIKVQNEVTVFENRLASINNQRDKLKRMLTNFETIGSSLESLRGKALKEYTTRYGPLTCTIQKRLRSVYGFGDIELIPEEGGIKVSVLRNGESIYPTDYFSESQMQIVMLSLFLSASLTQNWSSFSPILLDDPVTHFDDLNAYSLLDLVKGLLNEPRNKKQFIISTCEDRLYRLMRQKFSKINNKVIYYIFESFGNSGPIIRRLENH